MSCLLLGFEIPSLPYTKFFEAKYDLGSTFGTPYFPFEKFSAEEKTL